MQIEVTNNYEMFKLRKENREVNYNKVLRLKSTLLADGRQIMPIICNTEMEIIDGQHRFAALKELNWNIMYYIDDTITCKDLISINNTQTNWGLLDYIHYYASLGNETYIELEKLCAEYEGIPLRAVLLALGKKYIKEYDIKEGLLKFSCEEFESGKTALDFINGIKKDIRVRITSPATFFFLLLKTYFLQDIDRDRLYISIVSKYGTENYGSALQCAMAIEHWYNFRSKTYRYISNEIMPRR